ncbi:hypothetical protein DSCO28_07250 [Desulfosarcina ovata subsp. sediminis]|uniref:Uncharacterized protein n=1 Tax=Desulfosarcina ovata subsp. sediminis TaxID=885957 RepID=A0A5K7ZKI5_9BACT|nr:hypothetical protein [Desulfosarcina ovata]BBO80159.1 hypothetical protein DSCO28_07250 [Desulfosarcina ovata subsp. sediminis]
MSKHDLIRRLMVLIVVLLGMWVATTIYMVTSAFAGDEESPMPPGPTIVFPDGAGGGRINGPLSIGGADALTMVPDAYNFADATERDAYFTSNPSELVDDVRIHLQSTGYIQRYDLETTSFINMTALTKGPQGDAGTNGTDGTDGTNGANAYLYVAYASDGSGSDFSLTPSGSLQYRAEIQSTTEIASPDSDDFSTATWVKYIGDDGEDGTVGGDYSDILAALHEQGIYPGEIVFTTSGSTFEPTIILDGEATVTWTFSDHTTSSSTTPSIDFGSAATRYQRLSVDPWSALYRINVGYAGADGGASTDELGNTFEHVSQQSVSAVTNLSLVSDYLVYFCACQNPITDVDLSNFTALHTVELYAADLATIDISGTTSLARLQVENTDLAVLDLSGSLALEDIRASSNPYTDVDWGDGTYSSLWHICMRDTDGSYVITYPTAANMPNIRDLYIWNTNQTGAGSYTGLTALRNAQLYSNAFTSLDFTNSFASGAILDAHGNSLTTITLTGCTGLDDVDLSVNALTETAIDHVLSILDASGVTNGVVDLSGGTNASPSTSGLASIANLETDGWTCTYNEPAAPLLSSATIGSDGDTWTFVFTEAIEIGTGGSGGFAVTMTDAGAITLTYSSGDGTNTLVYSGSTTVESDDTVSDGLDYTQPGDGLENTSGVDLASFTDESVTNNSSIGPPTLSSATIGSDGDTWTLVFNKSVSIGTGGSGGFVATMTTAGTVNLTYSSGDESDTLVFTGDTTVNASDTGTLAYTQPGDGIEDGDGYDLATFSGTSVTNNSTEGQSASITFVDSCEAAEFNYSSDTLTTDSMDFVSGNVVVAVLQGWSNAPVSISDSLGNTYTLAGTGDSGEIDASWYYSVVSEAGSGTITATFTTGSGAYISVGALQFSGINTSSPVGTSPEGQLGSGLTISTTNANEVIIVAEHNEGGPAVSYTTTPSAAIVAIENLEYSAAQGRPMAYYIADSAQTDLAVAITPATGIIYSTTAMSLVGAVQ